MSISETIKKGIKYVQHYGAKELLVRLHEKRDSQDISYEEFCAQEKISEKELSRQSAESKKWAVRPLLSVVCITDEKSLMSVKWGAHINEQTYDNWELCVANSLADAVAMAQEDSWMVFVEPQDTLEPNALYEIALAISAPERSRQSGVHWENRQVDKPELIYSDEDVKAVTGVRPLMKPDFSLVMLEEVCYIKHLLAVPKRIAVSVLEAYERGENLWMGIASNCESAVPDCNRGNRFDLEDFACNCAIRSKYTFHVPKVLYHHLEAADENRVIEKSTSDFTPSTAKPLISIIIPNKDQKETLQKCLESVWRSTYTNYEIIIVENNSTSDEIFEYYKELEAMKCQVVTWESNGVFNFSAINNYGVSFAKGEYIVCLNNDIEILTPDWLERLLVDCQREEVAIAGAKLYYPDDTIQHAGIVIGIGGHARGIGANMCIGLDRKDSGYMDRASIRQNMSAVTAACFMMRKYVFEEVGGYNEYLTVAFNDVDLCLKVRKAGYEIIYDPYVEAYHYESKSRGMEDTEEKVRRFQTEIEYMRTEWHDILVGGDPYYNPNLTRYRMDYSLRRGQ